MTARRSTVPLTRARRAQTRYEAAAAKADALASDRDTAIWEALDAGYSYREVAVALGLNHSRVQQVANKRKEGER